jgi:dCTP deaminase
MSSLLSYNQLLKLLKDDVVLNSGPEFVNGASIDVTLGKQLLIEVNTKESSKKLNRPISLRGRDALPTSIYEMNEEYGYTLQPGEFVLAHTQQVFNLPISLTAQFHMKSSLGRVGLQHMMAGWCDPGWNNSTLTLELTNCTRYTPITVRPGDRIGQMTFQRVVGVPNEHGYGRRGRYNGDTTVSGVKP